MLTLRQFKALVDSYGADWRRWPDNVREQAQALAERSAKARSWLAQARELDAAIAAARAEDGAESAERVAADAALAHLRRRVSARIASTAQQSGKFRAPWIAAAMAAMRSPDLGLAQVGSLGLAAIAVIAGLLLGGLSLSAPASEALLSMLEPSPIHFLAD